MRDDRPFGGSADASRHPERQQCAAPAVLFHYSPTRDGEHPEAHLASYTGVMQADAYSGYNGLYVARRKPGPITEAACWAHGRRKLFELADLQKAPIAIEAVRRIDKLLAIEREINGRPPDQRLTVRHQRSRPLVDALEKWLRAERKKLSSKAPLAKAMDYSLKRWAAFTRFLDDGRICMTNNAAERAVRGIAVGRRNWTFCGSDSGGQRGRHLHADRNGEVERRRSACMGWLMPSPASPITRPSASTNCCRGTGKPLASAAPKLLDQTDLPRAFTG